MELRQRISKNDRGYGRVQIYRDYTVDQVVEHYVCMVPGENEDILSITPTSVKFRNNSKGISEYHEFEVSGTQAEMEELLIKMYWEEHLKWVPKFQVIPKKGLKVVRKSDQQLMFITNAADRYNSIFTLCSPSGEIIEMHASTIRENFNLSP